LKLNISRYQFVENLLKNIIQQQRILKTRLEETRTRMSKTPNRKWKDVRFEAGEEVMLNAKYIQTGRPNKKLKLGSLGPLKIKEMGDPIAALLTSRRTGESILCGMCQCWRSTTHQTRFLQQPISFNSIMDLNDPDVYNVEKIYRKEKQGGV
jgi:hypothetical protein